MPLAVPEYRGVGKTAIGRPRLDDLQKLLNPSARQRRTSFDGVEVCQDDMRNCETCLSEQFHIRREIGATDRANRDASLIKVNVQRLGEGRNEEAFGITLD